MGLPEWVAVASVVVALVSLAIEQRLTRQQSKADVKARHYDRMQTLILCALDDPSLLEAISGGSGEDERHRRYRQLWLNHVEMIFRQRQFFDRRHWQGTLNDIRSFVNMPVMRKHWIDSRQFYAEDFRNFMDQKILISDKAGTPANEAPPSVNQAPTT